MDKIHTDNMQMSIWNVGSVLKFTTSRTRVGLIPGSIKKAILT